MSDGFLKEIGRSYIVSAFLPAAFFVSVGYFLFQGFVPLEIVNQVTASSGTPKYQWVVISILIFWVAFYLYSANDVTVRLFEGYFIPEFFYRTEQIPDAQTKWEKKNLPTYTKWQQDKQQRENDVDNEEKIHKVFLSLLKVLVEISNVNLRKPLSVGFQMPTRLGNVLRSSEVYALERYYIVDTAVWPRLLPVLPSEIKKHLEEKNNLFMFLLNSAFLAYFLALISGVFGFIVPHIVIPKNFFYIGYEFMAPESFIGLSIVLLIFGYLLYRVAVNAAEDFTMYIRASFDLYRVNLLRQLNWDPPNTLDEEKNLWLEVSKLLIAGNRIEVDFSPFKRKFYLENQAVSPEIESKDG